MSSNKSSDQNEINIEVNDPLSFKIGEQFTSYDDVMQRLEEHSQQSFVYYWRRDSRTIQAANIKTVRAIDAKIKYYFVKFSCVFGGAKFTSKGISRKNVTSMRNKNCPAYFSLRLSKCGQFLEVNSTCNFHNHQISEDSCKLLSHSRRLPGDIKNEVCELLHYKIDKHTIIEYVHLKTGKTLSVKDLSNIGASDKIDWHKTGKKNVNELSQQVQNFIDDHKPKPTELPKFRTLHTTNINDSNSVKCNSYFRLDGDKMIEYILPGTNTESQELHTSAADGASLFSENCDLDEEVVLQVSDEQEPGMDGNIQMLSVNKVMNTDNGYRISINNQIASSYSVDNTIFLPHPANGLHQQFQQTVDKYFNFDYERDPAYAAAHQQHEEQLIPSTSAYYIGCEQTSGIPTKDECKLEEVDNENSTSSKFAGPEMASENGAFILQTSTEIVPESIVQQILVEEKNEEDELIHQNDRKNAQILDFAIQAENKRPTTHSNFNKKRRRKMFASHCKYCPRSCGRVLKMQLQLFKAQKKKVQQEIEILELKKQKLQREVELIKAHTSKSSI